MKKLLANPIVLLTLCANLAVGNGLLVLMNNNGPDLFMAGWLSLAAAGCLLGGFALLKANSRWWSPVLMAALFTLLIPVTGSFFMGFALTLLAEGPLIALGKGLVVAIFGGLLGGWLALPFVAGNMLAYALYRRKLRRPGAIEERHAAA